MVQQHIKTNPRKNIDSKLLDIIKAAPTDTGVYYMHREDGTIIYIGKSKNIQKRLNQHFTNDNRKSKKIQQEVTAVSYEKTGNELIALLKESEDIKQLNPKYNRALRKRAFNAQLTSFKDEKGYINLKIEKVDARKKAITTFSNLQSGKANLEKIIGKYALCQKLGGFQETDNACFSYGIKECLGACIEKESPQAYNKKVTAFLSNYSYQNQHMLIIDKGRNPQERSVVLIEKGIYRGFGYYTLNHQITNPEILKSIIRPMHNNRDAQHILQSYLRKRKVIKIINLDVNHQSL
jgi:DNA polymerase-3 subunit epsilon